MTTPAKNYSASIVYGCMMIGGAFDSAPLDDAQRNKGRAAIEAHNAAIHANMRRPEYGNPGEGLIEYCRLHDIQLQAWAPLAKGLLTGKADSTEVEPRVKRAADYVAKLASEWGVSREAVVIGWILRHPARIQPVVGTTNPDRLRAACDGLRLKFSREEWYQLYTMAMGHRVP